MEKKSQQLSQIQEVLLQLLKKQGVPQTDMIGVMLMLWDDNSGMADLAEYILNKEPSDTEIMIWTGKYVKENREKIFKATKSSR